MLLLHLESQSFGKNLTLAQVATPITSIQSPTTHQIPAEFWTTIAVLGISVVTLFREEIQRFDKRRDQEAKQAIAYVSQLKETNFKLEQEVKALRNQVLSLRVRLAQSEKEIEISSGELRRRETPREY